MQAADHAAEAGHVLCCACGGSLPNDQPQTCLPCIHDVRARLATIVSLYALLPTCLGYPKSPRMDTSPASGSDETPIPGGNALVMLAGGSGGRSQIRGVLLPNGERSDEHQEDEWETDAPSVAFELSRWEDEWRVVRGEAAAQQAATVTGASGYLSARMTWAADHHPAFDEFSSDLRHMLSRLRTITATDDRPERGAPCFEFGCGALLERRSGEESYTCPRCRRVYDSASYWLAVRAHAEAQRSAAG